MMIIGIDLTNKRFGHLVAIEAAPIAKSKKTRWTCRCDCGNVVCVQTGNLRSGRQVSCGCHGRSGQQNVKHGHNRVGQRSPTYSSWCAMRARCRDSGRYYGGKGIRVCARWDSFDNFLVDMGERPPGCTIDRIDGDCNYAPGNCRWATSREQSRNRPCVLNAHEVAEIVQRVHAGESRRAVARSLSIHHSTVRRYVPAHGVAA